MVSDFDNLGISIRVKEWILSYQTLRIAKYEEKKAFRFYFKFFLGNFFKTVLINFFKISNDSNVVHQ